MTLMTLMCLKLKICHFLFNANAYWKSGNDIFRNFNGDISLWDVSGVTNMRGMFNFCEQFNCDLSHWDVSNVENVEWMFSMCTKFNCDLSGWNVSNVMSMDNAFWNCPKIPKWYDKDKWDY